MGAQDIIAAIKGGLLQSDRLLKLDTPLGTNVLLPQRLMGYSGIGRDYALTFDAVSTTVNIELKTLVAQPATLWIQQSEQSHAPHHGYVHTSMGAPG
jgi:type VI secretion system secreted protein VgrG